MGALKRRTKIVVGLLGLAIQEEDGFDDPRFDISVVRLRDAQRQFARGARNEVRISGPLGRLGLVVVIVVHPGGDLSLTK